MKSDSDCIPKSACLKFNVIVLSKMSALAEAINLKLKDVVEKMHKKCIAVEAAELEEKAHSNDATNVCINALASFICVCFCN